MFSFLGFIAWKFALPRSEGRSLQGYLAALLCVLGSFILSTWLLLSCAFGYFLLCAWLLFLVHLTTLSSGLGLYSLHSSGAILKARLQYSEPVSPSHKPRNRSSRTDARLPETARGSRGA